ncbi:MAG: hypothetical protein Q7J84_18960 [Sulfuricaulis sp.]|nr:hypothetical protein [Sulfuricaulis sp.]
MRIRLPNAWEPRGYQLRAWKYLEQGGRHAELIWHRRAGKDDLCLHRTAVAAHERVGNYWHMLPQANQARKAIWEAINPHTGKKRIDEAFPIALRSATLNQEMLIRFSYGGTWQVVGSDNFNSLLGSPPVGLVFSEWPLCDPASWAYLMPILEENGGWAIFNGTPRGKNHAFRSVKGAMASKESFGEILSAAKTLVFTQAQLDRILEQLIETYGEEYGRSVFDQEYLVSFDAANIGAILGRSLIVAEREGRIADKHEYDPLGAPIEISSDIGRRDASTWWFWQPCVDGFRIVDHDRDSGLDADEWCDRLQKRIEENEYKLGKIWLPHDARAKTFAAKHSAVEIFLAKYGAALVGIVPESSKSDRINAARRVIRKTSFHDTKTTKGRDGLSAWSYVYDEERKEFSKEPDHNWASHDGDGYSYGAQVMEQHVIVDKEPEVARYIGVGEANTATLDDLWKLSAPQPRRI